MAQGWRELHCRAKAGSLLAVPAFRMELRAALDQSSSLTDQRPSVCVSQSPMAWLPCGVGGTQVGGKLSCPPRSPQSLAS